MSKIICGHVFRTRGIKAMFRNEKADVEFGFKPPKGNDFLVLYLGFVPIEGRVNPVAILQSLGWTPPSDLPTHTESK